MKISVIVPARKAEATLPRTLESLNAAAIHWVEKTGLPATEIEVVVSWDNDGRGPSWSRNRGLERAKGEYVFFCDADDTVADDFLAKPYAELERSGADLCFFTYEGGPELSNFTLRGNDKVRAAYLPAFFGYSYDDVRRWNCGGDLHLLKEPGQVWRCAYRRAFLDAHAIRFEETMFYYEDAAFLSRCVAFAESSVSIADKLYRYAPTAGGVLATGWKSDRHWQYKFLALEFRKRLDADVGGGIWHFCEASSAFSALEMLKEHRIDLARYLSNEKVVESIRNFPTSIRHPLVKAALMYLKWRVR